jgi:secondary thiamine-phosphate synthase enzyme
MIVHQATLTIRTPGQGTLEITGEIARELTRSQLRHGVATIFCQHTSASLVIMENADPSARRDLERWLNRLVSEDDPDFTHTLEGADDMPSHIWLFLFPPARGGLLRRIP